MKNFTYHQPTTIQMALPLLDAEWGKTELLAGGTLSRIQNAARTCGKEEKPLTVAEVFRALTDGIFADLPGPDGKVASGAKSSVVLRNLQRAYLARLSRMVVGPRSDPYASYYIVYGGSQSVPIDEATADEP